MLCLLSLTLYRTRSIDKKIRYAICKSAIYSAELEPNFLRPVLWPLIFFYNLLTGIQLLWTNFIDCVVRYQCKTNFSYRQQLPEICLVQEPAANCITASFFLQIY